MANVLRRSVGLVAWLGAAGASAAVGVGGCGGSSGGGPDANPPDAAAPNVQLAVPCTDTKDAVYTVASGLPAFDASHRGDIFRCSRDQWLDATTLDAAAHAQGFVGPTLTSGATIFRVAYRTERAAVGSNPPAEGHSAAFVLVPDHPKSPAATVVYVHGSVGLADICGPTHQDLSAHGDGWDVIRGAELGLVGAGYTVIAPDLAGFGFGDAPGFDDAEDEAKSVLDATRALTKLLPAGTAPTKIAIAGHSMGGHAVLSTQVMASTYGHDGEIIGYFGLAPFWVSNLAWGALMNPGAGYTTTSAPYFLEYQLDYFYGHGELLDGAGKGIELIQPAKQQAIHDLVTTGCLDQVATGLKAEGNTASDYFTQEAVAGLSPCGFTGDCTTAPAPTWEPRFVADRPALAKDTAPVILWFGGKDAVISPPFAECTQEKLAKDLGTGATTAITACVDPDALHGVMAERNVAWVGDWITANLTGAALPTCTPPKAPSAGGPLCPAVPPNAY